MEAERKGSAWCLNIFNFSYSVCPYSASNGHKIIRNLTIHLLLQQKQHYIISWPSRGKMPKWQCKQLASKQKPTEKQLSTVGISWHQRVLTHAAVRRWRMVVMLLTFWCGSGRLSIHSVRNTQCRRWLTPDKCTRNPLIKLLNMFQLQLHQKDIQYSTYLQQMQSNTNDWWSIQYVSRMCTMVGWLGNNGTLGTSK